MIPRWHLQDDLIVRSFDKVRIPFRTWFESVVGTRNLEDLHRVRSVTPKSFRDEVKRFQDEANSRAPELSPLVGKLLEEVVIPLFGPIASCQELPTFRAHFSVTSDELSKEAEAFNHLELPEFLKIHYFDNYRPGLFHRDKDYGLLHGSVNLWVPITDVEGASSVWIGTDRSDGRDALPVRLKYGECLLFDGANRWHGAVWNTSKSTRISFDIRFLPERHLSLVSAFA